jgi:peptidyl-prolyl cis-trans isomerase C
MSYPMRPAKTRTGIVTLTVLGLILSGPARAADTPASAPDQKPVTFANPADMMTAMADHLDQKPDFVVLQLETLAITQGDVAGVIRAMPPGMANLGYQEVYRRALDVMTRQKAMVLRARLEHIDKDPAVIHQGDIALERVLADAWLTRRANAAITDEALHARYDRDVVHKPGPDEVRARVILVPTQAEAQTLIQQVRDGADFADLARQYSKDPTAAEGGDLGYLTRNFMMPEVGAATFALSAGQVTAYPVPTPVGYFLIRVEGRRTGATPTFEQARPQLERDLRAEAISEAVGTLLSNVKFLPAGQSGGQATTSKP